jgi:1-acyl-sn-glycerol-3-phosphate acyltransferase
MSANPFIVTLGSNGYSARVDDATNQVVNSGIIPPRSFSEASRTASSRDAWHRCLYRFINSVYFERITLIHPERLPRTGPVLYLGLHRNGAVDGFVYDQVLRNPVFMISTQLRKSWFARLFFEGIAVTRTKDEGDRALNDAALRQCLGHLRAGGELFVFPEGTSSLGPRHLPFKSGAVWLLLDYLEGGDRPPLQVVPLGIHYECPWAFRGKVEVVVGPLISTKLPPDASRIERLKIMKHRMQAALEEVGLNVPSDECQGLIHRFASIATLGTGRSYFKSLKAMEKGMPEKIMDEWRRLEQESREAKLWFHQGVPLFPTGSVVLSLVALLAVSPIVLAAIALNSPAFVAGWYAGKKFPDGRNVVSLWKILVGLPAFALWIGVVVVTMLLLGKFLWLAAYVAVTCAGVKLYCRFKKLAVAVHNALRRPGLRERALAVRQSVLQSLPHETA